MAGRGASWGRFLGHGLISGTVVFGLMVLVFGLVPVGDGTAALLMYLALVVPPALTARRFARKGGAGGVGREVRSRGTAKPAVARAPRRTRPTAGEAAELAVTSYGEMLRLHPYRPGPSADPDDLADYRTTLEAYDAAKTSTPRRVPELLDRGREALERLDAARLAGTDIAWIHGTGDTRVRVPAPDDGPVLLVFESTDRHGGFSVSEGGGLNPRPRELFRVAHEAGRPVSGRVRVLLPAQRGTERLLDVWALGPWRLALRPPGEARRLETGLPLTGQGIETVLKDDGCRVAEFEHDGTGAFALHEVTRTHRTGRLLANGHGPARLSVALPESRRVLRVESTGRWTLRTPKGGHPSTR
ncbi:hypothetical protein [Streptomyces sp. NPDC006668]|uniref:hypothetical protein n=1 Tax=Streptomyces sp. NPDC006668 TaxID=3156903 RepID=UPI0033DE63FF